jgi:hypothetical protein
LLAGDESGLQLVARNREIQQDLSPTGEQGGACEVDVLELADDQPIDLRISSSYISKDVPNLNCW